MAYDSLYVSDPGDIVVYDGCAYKILKRKQGKLAASLHARLQGGIVWCDVIENGKPKWAVVRKMEAQDG